MAIRTLPPEIVSLVHHVELNESGWWEKAIGQIIQANLWLQQEACTLEELKNAMRRNSGTNLTDDRLLKRLDSLKAQGLVSQIGERYKLSERQRKILTAEHGLANAEQVACRERFVRVTAELCPELNADEVWEKFRKAIAKTVRIAGANFFHLLSDGSLQNESDWLSPLIKTFPQSSTLGLTQVFSDFFNPHNQECRSQVLRLLNAHFLAEASQLRQETLDALNETKKQRVIRVILDTNLLFSILKLHENPADDSALSLLDIAKNKNRNLDLRLYVLPGTIDEAQTALAAQVLQIEHIRTTRAMTVDLLADLTLSI